jgi:parallel beta-helix repeat protein
MGVMASTSGHQPRSWLAPLTIAILLAGCASPVPTASSALTTTPPPSATPTLAPTPLAPATPVAVVSTPVPSPAANPSASPTPAPTQTPPSALEIYVVVAGDTLSALARRYDVSLAALIAANPQTEDPNLIHPGDRIEIPRPPTSSGTLELTRSTTLTADHFGNILIVTDGITLDCAGHAVRGPGLDSAQGGILIVGVRGVTVRRCVIEDFAQNGLWAARSSDLVIDQNTARGNLGNGFVLERTTDSRLSANRASGNGDPTQPPAPGIGFWIQEGSDRNVLEGNVSVGNRLVGIAVEGVAVRLVRNTVSDNATDGISLLRSAGSVITSNTSTHNGANGFLFRNSPDLRIEDNTERDSVLVGFSVDQSRGATLLSNSASGSSSGFLLTASSGATLTGNTAVGNIRWQGFSLGSGAEANVLTDNTAIGNGIGFILWGTKDGTANGNTLTGNRADRNAMYGFEVANGASSNTIQSSTARANGDLDAFQQGDAGSGNRWVSNDFGTTSGF